MTTTIGPDTVPALHEDVAPIPVGDELLLHREDDGTLLLLDAIGALVLTLVDGQRSVGVVIDELVAVFDDAERAVVERDVLALLESLRDASVLALPGPRARVGPRAAAVHGPDGRPRGRGDHPTRRHAEDVARMGTDPVGDNEPWRRRVDVLARRVEEKWVLLAVDGEEAVVLDGIGAQVWDLLATPCTLAQLVTVLAGASDADADRVRDDLVSFLVDLEDHRLAERT